MLPFKLLDDGDFLSNGTLIFTDASWRFNRTRYLWDMLENRPWGRLLSYTEGVGIQTLRNDLYFANGVAISGDQQVAYVAETSRMRLMRVFLEGEKKGQMELVTYLPGYPDNIHRDSTRGRSSDLIWIACGGKRSAFVDFIQSHPMLKQIATGLFPASLLRMVAPPYGLVLAVNGKTGEIVGSLHDPGGKVGRGLSDVKRYGDYLFVGSLTEHHILAWKIPASWDGSLP